MEFFACPYLGREVQLTDERKRHIADRHPELLPGEQARMAETLADPDQVRRSARAANARLFTRWFGNLRGGKHVVVVVVLETPPRHSWVPHSLHSEQTRGGRSRMEACLTFKYDREADILYIDRTKPYAKQECEELGDDIIARLNPVTRDIENIEILFFSTRLLHEDLLELPVMAEMRLRAAA